MVGARDYADSAVCGGVCDARCLCVCSGGDGSRDGEGSPAVVGTTLTTRCAVVCVTLAASVFAAEAMAAEMEKVLLEW